MGGAYLSGLCQVATSSRRVSGVRLAVRLNAGRRSLRTELCEMPDVTSSSSSTKWAYQTVAVVPANWYKLDAFVYHDDPWVESVLLRISWYSST